MTVDSTIPLEQPFSTNTADEELPIELHDPPKKTRPRRSNRNRFKLHLRDNIVNYIFGLVISICVFFVVESKIKFAEINKDISYSEKSMSKVESILTSLDSSINDVSSKLQSLTDQFALFIRISSKKEP